MESTGLTEPQIQKVAAQGTPPGRTRRFVLAAQVAGVALAFGLGYGTYPLYNGNQNTYFAHGLARAGYGLLSGDWFVRTADPVPIFSLLVQATHTLGANWLFHVYHLIILGVYLFALADIIATAFGDGTRAERLTFLMLLAAVHSSALGLVSLHLLHGDVGAHLYTGVAIQGVLGSFQPSMFGVFLLVSTVLFLRGRPYAAAATAALTATVHPAYLLPAAILTGAYVAILSIEDRSVRRSVAVGAVALALVLPVVVYTLHVLGGASPEIAARAREIIARARIPHHTMPQVWFNADAAAKVILILLALTIVRRTRLFKVLLSAFAAALVLTLVQVATGSTGLALLFPWRISTILVPISTGVILAAIVVRFGRILSQRETAVETAAIVLLAAMAVGGLIITELRFDKRTRRADMPMMEYVRRTASPGEVYLIPTGLQDFRLCTRVPVLVDFKSSPYRDTEVIDWYERYRLAEEFYGGNCALLAELVRRYGITHVVLRRDDPRCKELVPLYDDGRFAVCRLRGAVIHSTPR